MVTVFSLFTAEQLVYEPSEPKNTLIELDRPLDCLPARPAAFVFLDVSLAALRVLQWLTGQSMQPAPRRRAGVVPRS